MIEGAQPPPGFVVIGIEQHEIKPPSGKGGNINLTTLVYQKR